MLKLSGELITDLNLIIQVKMMFVFQICSDIKLMDKQSTDDSHFNLGKDFIVIDCTTEISINQIRFSDIYNRFLLKKYIRNQDVPSEILSIRDEELPFPEQ
mgnify:CR=1 FL=1